MAEKNKEKLPQNMQNLLMEIGEKAVLFHLFILAKNTSWDVYYNLGEVGCDLVLIDSQTNKKLKLEVKTRQRMYTTSKDANITHFTITEIERNSSDYVICYWFEENAFFIVPIDKLTATSSNGKPLFKFIVRKCADGSFDSKSQVFLNKWDIIKSILDSGEKSIT